jgi:hypothetical protein
MPAKLQVPNRLLPKMPAKLLVPNRLLPRLLPRLQVPNRLQTKKLTSKLQKQLWRVSCVIPHRNSFPS